MTRDEFLATRRTGIGGSDVAAIMGISRYKTPQEVFRSKTTNSSTPDNEAMMIGRLLEPFVIQQYAAVRGVTVRHVDGVLRHPDYPELLANLDGYTDEPRIVEAKTAYACNPEEWGEEGTDEIPADYFCQVQHYMLVTGYKVADVPVFFRSERKNAFRIYTVEANPDFQQDIKEVCLRFWADTLAGFEPEPVTFEEMAQRWQDRCLTNGETIITSTPDTITAIGELRAVRQDITTLEEKRDELTRFLKKEMGEASALMHDGRPLITWKMTKARKSFDADLFKTEQPELFAQYQRETNPYRVFLLK